MPEEKAVLRIEGMTCDGCAQGVQHALKRVAGVSGVKMDWRTGLGEVMFDTEVTSEQDILEDPIFLGHYKASLVARPGCC